MAKGNKGQRRDPKREAFWRGVLARQRGSGLNVRAFCRRQGLAESGFHAWRRTIDRRDREDKGDREVQGRPAFLPVMVRGEAAKPCGVRRPAETARAAYDAPHSPREAHEPIVIELRGGRVMRLAASMSAGRLASLIHAIERMEQAPHTPIVGQEAA